jgi:hypothetical protein
MRSVISDNVSDIGYDDETGELHVVWKKSGKTSVYSGVPAGVASQTMNAFSVGQAISQDIKPNYPHRYA